METRERRGPEDGAVSSGACCLAVKSRNTSFQPPEGR